MGKELEFWKHRALTGEGKMQELRDEFGKQGRDCLDMGGKLALSCFATSRPRFDKALEAYKKEE